MVEKKASRFTIVNKREDAEAIIDQEEKKGEDILLKKRKRKERNASSDSSASETERKKKKKKKKKDKRDKAEKRARRSRSGSEDEREKTKPERWVPPDKNQWTGLPFSPKFFDIL